jgi:VIT1/CCC1 family predicted Fe2+/Mn2+ transporter
LVAGEHVLVSSQTDKEKSDIEREKQKFLEMPEVQLRRLANSYEQRGLKIETDLLDATELIQKAALAADVRDELGINEINQAKTF